MQSAAPGAGSLHNPAGTGSVPVAPGLQLHKRDLSPAAEGVCPPRALRGPPHSLPSLLGAEECLCPKFLLLRQAEEHLAFSPGLLDT